jgi:phosphate transport system ATP-binding protein
VTHGLAQARRLADRVAFLLDGEVVEVGEREQQIVTAPADSRTRDYIASASADTVSLKKGFLE